MVERVLAKDESGVRFSVPARGTSDIQKLAFGCPRDDVRSSEASPALSIGLCSDEPPRIMRSRSRGETDITTVFGTVVPGSNPGGSNAIHLCVTIPKWNPRN